jgi:DNA-binding transcriptional LysR family regulator
VVSVITEGALTQQLQQLRDRQVDFLVRRVSDALDDDLNVEALYQDRLFIVSSQNSPWGRRRKIDLSELVTARWLLSPNFYGPILADVFEASGLVTPEVSVKSFSTHQTINLLATGRFVSALSGSQLYFNGARFSLKALPVEIATRPWMMSIVTLKDRTVSPIVQTFMRCVREIARPLTDMGLCRKVAGGG